MANPRKFSEKIALHTHRQAEETARFEQIMKEVSDATARVAPDKQTQSSKNTLRISTQSLGSFRGGSLPNVSAGSTTVKTASRSSDPTKPEDIPLSHSHTNMVSHRESRERARSQGGPIRRQQDRKHDTSPYSAGPFLSPPPDTSWRRTNSDSALHQSAMQGIGNERNDNSTNRWMQNFNGPEQHDGRPKSSCEVPRVPGINIYPSAHEPGTIQIPIGNNTGSLPDLTSVHFPSPIPPIDRECDQGSYSSSPVNTSPSTLSPTSMQHGMRQQGRFQFVNQTSPHHAQNHLSVPNSRYHLHHTKSLPMEKTLSGVDNNIDYTQLSGMNMYQQPQKVAPSSPSPTLQQSYRSPRPSPQSSPGLGHHSAPCSPGTPSPLPSEYQLFSHSQLQQHFEQFSMVDTPVSQNLTYVEQPQHMTQSHPQTFTEVTGTGQIELLNDGGYYSTSPQFAFPAPSPSLHTTPNTPTSIPDIILTDFSAEDELSRNEHLQLSKHLELFDNDALREGLEPIDFDGLQMLSESEVGVNFIPDSVEDHFRLDRS